MQPASRRREWWQSRARSRPAIPPLPQRTPLPLQRGASCSQGRSIALQARTRLQQALLQPCVTAGLNAGLLLLGRGGLLAHMILQVADLMPCQGGVLACRLHGRLSPSTAPPDMVIRACLVCGCTSASRDMVHLRLLLLANMPTCLKHDASRCQHGLSGRLHLQLPPATLL